MMFPSGQCALCPRQVEATGSELVRTSGTPYPAQLAYVTYWACPMGHGLMTVWKIQWLTSEAYKT